MEQLREKLYRAVAFGAVGDMMDAAAAAFGAKTSLYSSLMRLVAGDGGAPETGEREFKRSFPTGGGDTCRLYVLGGVSEAELIQDGEPVAYIFIENDRPDPELLEILCRGVNAMMRRREAAMPGHKFSTELFIRRLFSGGEAEVEAELLGIAADGEFVVFSADIRHLQPDIAKTASVVDGLDAICGAPSAVLDGFYSALIPAAAYEKKRSRLAKFASEHNLSGAESRVFRGIQNARTHFLLTERSIRLRDCVGKTVGVVFYDEIEPYLMADSLYGGEAYLHPTVRLLSELDKTGKFSFIETLEAYLGSGLNVPEASRRLHIHRNTMDYRLARLEEKADIDWGDGELLFRLFLSLHNLKYNSTVRGEKP